MDESWKKLFSYVQKTYSTLKDNNDEGKKAKGTKKRVIKRKMKFENYKNYLKASQIINIVNYVKKKEADVDSFKEDS